MSTEVTSDLIITTNDNPSKFFFKILQTIPFRPEYLPYANFIANGLSKKDREYNKKCLDQRIIPHSYLSLKTYADKDTFTYNENKLSETTDNFHQVLKGGRIHQISFVDSWMNEKNFARLLTHTKELIAEGYVPTEANIWLTTRRLTGYHGGYDGSTELSWRTNMLKLEKGHSHPQEKIARLESWFNNLKDEKLQPKLF